MPCSPCHPSHCPSCYTTHFWVKQRQERAPGNEHRLMISRENRPEPRREQTSHTMKRITRESIFCFKVMFQNLDYLEQRCWAGGKKMDRKREMNQSLKAEGKHEKCWNEAWGRSSGLWFLHLLNQNDGLCFCSPSGLLLMKEVASPGGAGRCRPVDLISPVKGNHGEDLLPFWLPSWESNPTWAADLKIDIFLPFPSPS